MRLPHLVCTGLLVVAAFRSSRAQSAAPRRFGIVGGMNSMTVGGPDAHDPTPDRRTGWMGGVMLVLPISASFAFQPELLYSMKGADINDVSGSGSLKLNYGQIPLLARFDFATSGGARPFVYAGPAVSLKSSCTIVFGGTSEKCDPSSTDVKSNDVSVIIGGGLAFDLSGKTLTVGARYDHSLGKFENDFDVRHRVISVLGTLEFPWGK